MRSHLIGAMLPRAILGAALLLFGVSREAAAAGVPPHPPGTVCYTPSVWCWANPPGRPGTRCVCPTPKGAEPGYRG